VTHAFEYVYRPCFAVLQFVSICDQLLGRIMARAVAADGYLKDVLDMFLMGKKARPDTRPYSAPMQLIQNSHLFSAKFAENACPSFEFIHVVS